MTKDSDEIALLRLAAQAADRVVAQIAAGRLVGRTEADVAREVRERLIAEGHEEALFRDRRLRTQLRLAAPRGVGAGHPRPASRSSSTSAARSAATAATSPGRCGSPAATRRRARTRSSDTSSACCTQPRRRRRDAVRPGVACEAIDAAARDLIAAEGYGEAFFHRTGHGIGLEGHEDPYLVAGNRDAARAKAWRSASSRAST